MAEDKSDKTSGTTPNDQTPKPPENNSNASQAVTEGDLVAVKKGLQAKVDAAERVASEEHAARLQAEAKVKSLEEKATAGAKAAEELAQARTALDAQTKRANDAVTRALAHRKALISKEYGIPVDTLKSPEGKDFDDVELDMFEKALKVTASVSGSGRYASGGGGGAGAPTSSMDRAAQILEKAKQGSGKGNKL